MSEWIGIEDIKSSFELRERFGLRPDDLKQVEWVYGLIDKIARSGEVGEDQFFTIDMYHSSAADSQLMPGFKIVMQFAMSSVRKADDGVLLTQGALKTIAEDIKVARRYYASRMN